MENNVQTWSKVTKSIFTGVLLYSVATVAYAIFNPIANLAGAVDSVASFAGESVNTGSSALSLLCYLFLAGIVAGYVLFLLGLGNFSKVVNAQDGAAVGKVRTGTILVLIGVVVGALPIPVLSWLGELALCVIGYIMMLMGYSSLKASSTFPAKARSGASLLFIAMILIIIGEVLGLIPFAGGFIEMPLDVIAFIMVLIGWSSIKNADPAAL